MPATRPHKSHPTSWEYSCIPQHLPCSHPPAAAAGGGARGWLWELWDAMKNAAAQQALQQHLRRYLRHESSPGQLAGAAGYMQRLLRVLGGAGTTSSSRSTSSSSCSGALSGARPPGEAPAAPPPGPGLLGVSAAEAIRMGPAEWGDLVAAAARSHADSASPSSPSSGSGWCSRARAGQLPSSGGGAGNASGSGAAGAGAAEVAYLSQLADQLPHAHGALQHSVVALYYRSSGSISGAGGGPAGLRQLQQLASSLEQQAQQLESLLLSLPDRQAAVQAQEAWQRAQRGGGWWGPRQRRGGSGGLFGRLLRAWYGVEVGSAPTSPAQQQQQQQASADTPPVGPAPDAGPGAGTAAEEVAAAAEHGFPGIAPEALLQQAHFALAVHAQRAEVQVALGRLAGELAALRRGQFC